MATETPETVADIVDIPEDIPEKLAEIAEDVAPAMAEAAPDSAEPVEKKKPGRPAGSRNKGPSKPRAKKVVVSEAVEYAPPNPEPPQWDAQHQPIPIVAKTEMAELMLRLLTGQSAERQRKKDALRRSWFA